MKPALIFGLALALAACTRSESDSAVTELQMLQSAHASPQEVCAARRKVEAAYLKEGNAAKYRDARAGARTACLDADLSAQLAT